MMSNSSSSLQPRPRSHQRQNSTPVSYEAMTMQQQFPAPTTQQRRTGHRRGLSCDSTDTTTPGQYNTGNTGMPITNTGTTTGQKLTREAQQHRSARPGRLYIQPYPPKGVQINHNYPGYIPYKSPYDGPQDMTNDAFMCDQINMSQHSRNKSLDNSFYSDIQPDMTMGTSAFAAASTPSQQFLTQTASSSNPPAYTPLQNKRNNQFYGPTLSISLHENVDLPYPSRQQQQDIISPRPISMQTSRSLQDIAEHQEVQSFTDIFPPAHLDTATQIATGEEPVKQKQHHKTESLSSVTSSLYGEIGSGRLSLKDKKPNLVSDGQPSSPARTSLSPRRMSISDLNLEPGISASIAETDISLDDIAQYIEGPDPLDNKWICVFENCNKRFGRKENIKSHVQTHLGDRQFKCDHCQKCFVRGHDLKRHAKIHTGNRAYTCLCGNAFARHDALTRHRQRGMCIGAFEGIVRKDVKRGRPRKHRPEMDDRLNKASRTRAHGHARSGTDSSINYNDLYNSSASSCSMSSWGSPPAQSLENISIQSELFQPSTAYEETLNLFGLSSQELDINPDTGLATVQQVNNFSDAYSFTPPHSPGFSTGNKPSPYHYRELTPTELASFDAATSPQHHSPMTKIVTNKFDLDTDLLAPQDLMLDTRMTTAMTLDPPSTVSLHFDLPSAAISQTSSFPHSTSMPALSHSSSPPPEESQPASTLNFDFEAPIDFRMSTISNISSMSFGLSTLNKIADNVAKSKQNRVVSRNQFDDFLDFTQDNDQTIMATDNDTDYAFNRQDGANGIDWCS